MRRALPYVALLAFSLTLIQPLLSSNQICVDDLQFHVHKAYELENLIRSGNFFPRWSPDMGRGYGYPLFNFYAPLSSYVVLLFHLGGVPYTLVGNVTLAFYLFLAGASLFNFARDLFEERAAFVSAIAYMSAPYLAYNIMFRGALAEVSGWMWIPLALWAIRRAMTRSSWRWAITGAICYAALIPSHNLLALISTPMIVGWVIMISLDLEGFSNLQGLFRVSSQTVGAHPCGRPVGQAQGLPLPQIIEKILFRQSKFGIVAITLGLSLAAYFWLPVLIERSYVRIDRLLDSTVLQYFNNFIAPSELYSQWTSDPLLFNPAPSRGLGLITALLASLGAITFVITTIRSQRQILSPLSFISPISFLIFTTLLYCFLTLQISQPIWDVTPLMPFFQFPWRMLTPAALGAAVMIGILVGATGRSPLPTWVAGAALILFNLPWWTPTYCGVMPPTTPETIRQFRSETFMKGAYDYSEYLPMWVKKFPQDDELFNALIEGKSPDRLVIANAKIESSSTNPLNANYAVTVSQNTEAIYKQFYYPGWSVEVDGKQIEIQPDPESGVIRFNVPAGIHTLRVQFGETPLRLLADVISGLAVIACLIVATPDRSVYNSADVKSGKTCQVLSKETLHRNAPANTETLRRNVSTKGWAALIVLGLGLLALRDVVLDRSRTSSFDGEKVADTKPLRASFAGGVELYGYDLNSTVASGDWFDVTLYAGVKEKLDRAYVPTISVEDERGLLVSEADVTFPRWLRPPFSANQWDPNYYALWARRVTILSATPPGTYRVWGKVFDADDPSHTPDSVIDSQGNALAPRFDLGTITVTRPAKAASIETLKMQNVSNTKLNESLTLLGWNVDRAEAKAGDTVLMTLFWKLEKEMIKDQRLEIGLSDASGKSVFAKEIDPVSENFPTSQWKNGDVWRGQYMIRLPAALTDGGYRWGITLKGESASAALGGIRVSAPQRSFIAPNVDQKIGVRFDSFAELVGYSIRDQKIILVWRALQTPEKNYSVFVHIGDTARVWAQSDGVPQNWNRPTIGWVEGEYVVDERAIIFPPDTPRGEYAIYVGMADVVTGERAKINDREDRIRIGVWQK